MVFITANGTKKPRRQLPRFQSFMRLNVYELDEYLGVEAFIPGAKKESFEVALEDGILTLKAECPAYEQTGRVLMQEFAPGLAERSVRLPIEVDPERAEASYEDGVLRIYLPKTTRSQKRNIPIN